MRLLIGIPTIENPSDNYYEIIAEIQCEISAITTEFFGNPEYIKQLTGLRNKLQIQKNSSSGSSIHKTEMEILILKLDARLVELIKQSEPENQKELIPALYANPELLDNCFIACAGGSSLEYSKLAIEYASHMQDEQKQVFLNHYKHQNNHITKPQKTWYASLFTTHEQQIITAFSQKSTVLSPERSVTASVSMPIRSINN